MTEVRRHGGNYLSMVRRTRDGFGLELARWRAGQGTHGRCLLAEHLIFVTLAGSLARTRAVTEGGESYDGPDFPGAVTFIPAHHERRAQHEGGIIEYLTIRIDPLRVRLPEAAGNPATVEFIGFTDRADPFVRQLALALTQHLRETDDTSGLLAESIMATTLLHIVHRHSNRAAAAGVPPPELTGQRLRHVIRHIDEHLGDSLRLGDLAALAGMDVYQFGRAFRAATGSPPYRYVTERRIQRAAELLRTPHSTIAEIAHEVGLSSQSHLTTMFRKVMGTTPHAYRTAR